MPIVSSPPPPPPWCKSREVQARCGLCRLTGDATARRCTSETRASSFGLNAVMVQQASSESLCSNQGPDSQQGRRSKGERTNDEKVSRRRRAFRSLHRLGRTIDNRGPVEGSGEHQLVSRAVTERSVQAGRRLHRSIEAQAGSYERLVDRADRAIAKATVRGWSRSRRRRRRASARKAEDRVLSRVRRWVCLISPLEHRVEESGRRIGANSRDEEVFRF